MADSKPGITQVTLNWKNLADAAAFVAATLPAILKFMDGERAYELLWLGCCFLLVYIVARLMMGRIERLEADNVTALEHTEECRGEMDRLRSDHAAAVRAMQTDHTRVLDDFEKRWNRYRDRSAVSMLNLSNDLSYFAGERQIGHWELDVDTGAMIYHRAPIQPPPSGERRKTLLERAPAADQS